MPLAPPSSPSPFAIQRQMIEIRAYGAAFARLVAAENARLSQKSTDILSCRDLPLVESGLCLLGLILAFLVRHLQHRILCHYLLETQESRSV
jgi:hypothetical protein